MARSPNPSKAPSQRQLSVGEKVRHALTEILQRGELRDPRVALRITGATDGSAADIDRATGSAALLANDRARAVAAALAARGVPIERTQISNAEAGARRARHVLITLAFIGEEGTP